MDDLGGLNVIAWVLKSKEPFSPGSARGTTLLALRMEEEAEGQGTWVASTARRDQEVSSPLEHLGRTFALPTPRPLSSETPVEFLAYRNVR